MQVVLASTSKFRKAQLEQLGIQFEAVAPACDEEQLKKENAHLTAEEMVQFLSRTKAQSLKSRYPDAIIIGSDQSAIIDGQRLGKPHTRSKNIEDLKKLAGREHTLATGLCMLKTDQLMEHTDFTQLLMHPLTEQEIAAYVDYEKAFECAGGYKIEGRGLALFESVESRDHSSIIGLPMMTVVKTLRAWGYPVF